MIKSNVGRMTILYTDLWLKHVVGQLLYQYNNIHKTKNTLFLTYYLPTEDNLLFKTQSQREISTITGVCRSSKIRPRIIKQVYRCWLKLRIATKVVSSKLRGKITQKVIVKFRQREFILI